jgi:glycine cleavage system transcriptional repressor
MTQLVVTAFGKDRPGLVGEITGLLLQGGANLADSRMVNLRGSFAILMLVEGADEALDRLAARLPDDAKKLGLQASVDRTTPATTRPGIPFKLATYSLDQPGIVHHVTSALRKHDINIEDLQTKLDSAPFMGSPLFTLQLRMTVPPSVKIERLREELRALGETLNADIDLEPA